jgi:GT2 family glycosyltransferase
MKPNPPTVDVVLLSWNRLEDTLAAAHSVLAQDVDSLSLWIVDQGSGPEQVAALRELSAQHGEVHLLELSSNVGVPAGRNIGINSGTAEFVVCLDNDAVFDSPHALSRAVERLASDQRLGAVAFRAEDYETGELDLTSWAYPRVHMGASEPVPVIRFVGLGHALRRAAFIEVGGYDQTLFFCEEELDLSYRMIDRGFSILYDPSIVVLHKSSPENRVDWNTERVYQQVRNAVVVHHRHHRRLAASTVVASGWLLRAVFNGHGAQAVRGIKDAIGVLHNEDEPRRLSAKARRYVWEHDTRLRGSLLNRLRHDVLATLPGRGETGKHFS